MNSKKLQVFISSTYEDLKEERQAAVLAVLDAGHIPAGMELFTSGDEEQLRVIERWIDESDIFLLLLGGRYGSVHAGKSYVQIEYEYALKQKKPFFSLLIDDNALKAKVKSKGIGVWENEHPQELKAFRALLMQNLVAYWRNTRDIEYHVGRSLRDIEQRQELIGWVRQNDPSLRTSTEYQALLTKLQGVERAMERYRRNGIENHRTRYEAGLTSRLNVTGFWQCQEKSILKELFDYAGVVISHYITGTHEHWLYGIWSADESEIQTQVWRRERNPHAGKEKRLTFLFARIYDITESTFSTEVFASDGQADFHYNASELLTWKKVVPNTDASVTRTQPPQSTSPNSPTEADNMSRRGPADARRINIRESWEVAYWTKSLGVTEAQLRAAVNAVGMSVAAVRQHLDNKG